MKFFISSLLILSCSSAIAQSGLEKLVYELEYRNYILNGSKNRRPFEPSLECPKSILEAHKYWKNNRLFNGYMEEGSMEKAFSTDEILEMKNVNIHGIVGKIRGTDKITTGGYSVGSSPSFPHTKPGCEKYFQEEVKIVKIDDKNCREITFKDPNSALKYKQMYCENSSKIYINIDPNINKEVDDNPCNVGNDLIHCNKVKSR